MILLEWLKNFWNDRDSEKCFAESFPNLLWCTVLERMNATNALDTCIVCIEGNHEVT